MKMLSCFDLNQQCTIFKSVKLLVIEEVTQNCLQMILTVQSSRIWSPCMCFKKIDRQGKSQGRKILILYGSWPLPIDCVNKFCYISGCKGPMTISRGSWTGLSGLVVSLF